MVTSIDEWWTDGRPNPPKFHYLQYLYFQIPIAGYWFSRSPRLIFQLNFRVSHARWQWPAEMRNWIRENINTKRRSTDYVTNECENFVDSLLADRKVSIDFDVSSFNSRKREKKKEKIENRCVHLAFDHFETEIRFGDEFPSDTHFLRHTFIISPAMTSERWYSHRPERIQHVSKYSCDLNRHIRDRVEWSRQMEMAYKWHLMKRIVTLVYLFFSLFFLPSLSSHWFIARCTMVYAPRVQHLFHFIKTKAHTHTRGSSSWSTLCDLSCAFFRHVCVTRGDGESDRRENFGRMEATVDVMCVARPENYF